MSNDYRCDDCGKFIAYDDFDNGAILEMTTPATEFISEVWETVCIKCSNRKSK